MVEDENTLQVPLPMSVGLTAALDQFEGVDLVVRKGEVITQATVDAYPGDAADYKIVVRRTPDVESVLRSNMQSKGVAVAPARPSRTSSLERTIEQGVTLFLEGDTSTEMYILMSGCVAVLKDDKVVAEIDTPGTFIGEMSALLDEPRTATIQTREESVFTVVPGESLLETAKHHPTILLKLCRSLARKVSNTTAELMQHK
jgi:hypothetical protein